MTTTKATRDVIDLATRPITNLQCTGGNIDGTVIGNTTPAVGKFTNLFGNAIKVNASGNLDVSAGGVTIIGTINAYYAADIAECYLADAEYAPGTVLAWGGSAEVTTATDPHTVAGVVTTNPSFLLNSLPAEGDEIKVGLTLMGRVPVRVVGPVKKHDLLVLSSIPGVAKAAIGYGGMGVIVGRALTDATCCGDPADCIGCTKEHLVEAAVRFHIG